MQRKIKSLVEFLKQHNPPMTRAEFISIYIVMSLILLGSSAFVYVIINVDALKAIIEAEATILGFFGLTTVYLLSSLDSRIDRLDEQKHEYEIKIIETPVVPLLKKLEAEVDRIKTNTEEIKKTRTNLVRQSAIMGMLLIVSLLSYVGLLGFQSSYAEAIQNLKSPYYNLAGVAAAIPIELFFFAIWIFFVMFRKIGQNR